MASHNNVISLTEFSADTNPKCRGDEAFLKFLPRGVNVRALHIHDGKDDA